MKTLGLIPLALLLALLVTRCARQSDGVSQRRQTLAGIGASDAAGVGALDPDRENWVAQLGARFPAGTRVVNLGISGATVSEAVEQELDVAVAARPSVAAVWLGVNDFSDNVPLTTYTQNLAFLLHALRRDGQTRVYVANLPDLRLLPSFHRRDQAALAASVAQWNAAIARTAAEQGATLVDLAGGWPELRDHPDYISSDGLHPTSAGYRRIADLFWRAIERGSHAATPRPSGVATT